MNALADHLATGTATVCRAWIVRRKDGAVFGFTDHDLPLSVEGVDCRASSGLRAGALQTGTGLAVDNVEAHGALSADAITEEDLRAGLWDDAGVTTYLVNWSEPSQREILFRGSLGEISWGEGGFSAELRGLAEALNRVRGRVFESRCDALLGDGRCRKALGPLFTLETEVVDILDAQQITIPPFPEFASKWFERGRIEVLSGSAKGLSERIKTDRLGDGVRTIGLWQSLRRPIEPGVRVRIEAGCDKRFETCRFKFDNAVNFRGFPSIPGDDWLMSYPRSDGRNDGSAL